MLFRNKMKPTRRRPSAADDRVSRERGFAVASADARRTAAPFSCASLAFATWGAPRRPREGGRHAGGHSADGRGFRPVLLIKSIDASDTNVLVAKRLYTKHY